MLGHIDAHANLAVRDLDAARKFYEDILGLTQATFMNDELIVYRSGDTTFNVYRSREAGTNKATAVTWQVGDRIEDVVKRLAARGVEFEHHGTPHMRLEGDIHVAGDMKLAWFKDPDGNILNLVSM